MINEQHSGKYSTVEAVTFENDLAKTIIKMLKEMYFIEEEMVFLDEENIEDHCLDVNEPLVMDIQESEQSTASKFIWNLFSYLSIRIHG